MPRILREIGAQIALMALVLRALIPVGWMPSSAPGELITFCTHGSTSEILVGQDGQPIKPGPQHDRGGHTEICPFAAAAHLAPPAVPVALRLPVERALGRDLRLRIGTLAARRRFSRQLARGPPRVAKIESRKTQTLGAAV